MSTTADLLKRKQVPVLFCNAIENSSGGHCAVRRELILGIALMFTLCVSLFAFRAASAASIQVLPTHAVVDINDTFSVTIVNFDFPERLVGGLDVRYDTSILQVLEVNFSSSTYDIHLVGAVDNTLATGGHIDDILVAPLFTLTFPEAIITVVEFLAVGSGISVLDLAPTSIGAPWLTEDGREIFPLYIDGSVSVNPIPLPSALLLLSSTLVCLPRAIRRLG